MESQQPTDKQTAVAKRRRKASIFSSTEKPRNVDPNGTAPTPSWFRYANIDGADQSYATMPQGYQWDVEYYRREDGTLITKPTLTKGPPVDGQPRKKARLDDYIRSKDIKEDELTDEGIEDISSDEELYTKSGLMNEVEDEEEDRDGRYIHLPQPSRRLLPRTPRKITHNRRGYSVSSLWQSPSSSLTTDQSVDSASIMAPEIAQDAASSSSLSSSQHKRVDSPHTPVLRKGDEHEQDDEEEDLDEETDQLEEDVQAAVRNEYDDEGSLWLLEEDYYDEDNDDYDDIDDEDYKD